MQKNERIECYISPSSDDVVEVFCAARKVVDAFVDCFAAFFGRQIVFVYFNPTERSDVETKWRCWFDRFGDLFRLLLWLRQGGFSRKQVVVERFGIFNKSSSRRRGTGRRRRRRTARIRQWRRRGGRAQVRRHERLYVQLAATVGRVCFVQRTFGRF